MNNFLIGNPNQYVFQNPNEMFPGQGQENFFFGNNGMPQLDYNMMNGFPPNFLAPQSQFNPNDFLTQNNIILANNNLMMPNNLAMGQLNGFFFYMSHLKFFFFVDFNFLNMNAFNPNPGNFILSNNPDHGQLMAPQNMMNYNGNLFSFNVFSKLKFQKLHKYFCRIMKKIWE